MHRKTKHVSVIRKIKVLLYSSFVLICSNPFSIAIAGWGSYENGDLGDDDISQTIRSEYIGKWQKIECDNGPDNKKSFAMCYDHDRNEFYLYGDASSTETNEFWRFNIPNKEWILIDEDAEPDWRTNHEIFYYNDHIFSFGGGHEYYGFDYSNETWKYNIIENHWENITSPGPSKRYGFSLAFDGYRFCYLYGGKNETDFFNDLWAFDVVSESWMEIDNFNPPEPRSDAGMIFDKGCLFLFGGYTYPTQIFPIHRYNISNQTWTAINGSKESHPRFKHTMVIEPKTNEIYIYGGHMGGADQFYDLKKFSIESYKWSTVTDVLMDTPGIRTNHGMILDKDENIYLFGGWSNKTIQNDLWRYNTHPAKYPPSLKIPIPDTPEMNEDNITSGHHLIDLYDHFDDYTGRNSLRFEISYMEDPSIVTAMIDGHFIDFIQQKPNWFGAIGFKVKAYNKGWDDIPKTTDDLWIESNLFNISVLPTNDPPEIVNVFGDDDWIGKTYVLVVGNTFSGTILLSDIDNQPVTYNFDSIMYHDFSSSSFQADALPVYPITIEVVFTPEPSDVGWVNGTIFFSDGNGSAHMTLNLSFYVKSEDGQSPPETDSPLVTLISPSSHDMIYDRMEPLMWSTNWTHGDLLYCVYLGRDNQSNMELIGETTDTQLEMPQLQENTTYFWTVVPYNGTIKGYCTSGTWSFFFVKQATFAIDWIFPDETIFIEAGNVKEIHIPIINNGNLADRPEIHMIGPEWAIINSRLEIIQPNESYNATLIINPPYFIDEGKYAINITIQMSDERILTDVFYVVVTRNVSIPIDDRLINYKTDAFPDDLSASVDSDGDGSPDSWNQGMNETDSTTGLHLDAFPDDPAASIDEDDDLLPDEWNPGMGPEDSTTGLTLDPYPNDPDNIPLDDADDDDTDTNGTSSNNSNTLIWIAAAAVIVVVIALVIVIFLRKKPPIEPEDDHGRIESKPPPTKKRHQ